MSALLLVHVVIGIAIVTSGDRLGLDPRLRLRPDAFVRVHAGGPAVDAAAERER